MGGTSRWIAVQRHKGLLVYSVGAPRPLPTIPTLAAATGVMRVFAWTRRSPSPPAPLPPWGAEESQETAHADRINQWYPKRPGDAGPPKPTGGCGPLRP